MQTRKQSYYDFSLETSAQYSWQHPTRCSQDAPLFQKIWGDECQMQSEPTQLGPVPANVQHPVKEGSRSAANGERETVFMV